MYFENPTQDYFNIDKKQIKAIISAKKWAFLRHTPDYYGPKDSIWYALIRGINCQWCCHYCYLQSYYKNPDIVKFTNTQDWLKFLKNFLDQATKKFKNKKIIFYDGDFQDSFGYFMLQENIDQIYEILKLFANYSNVYLELRTKQALTKPQYLQKVEKIYDTAFSKTLITAITFSPQRIIDLYEPGTTDLENRINFAKWVQSKGFQVGIRIDPIIADKDLDFALVEYKNLIDQLQTNLNPNLIFNRWIWVLRIKKSLYSKLKKSKSGLINNLVLDNWFYKYPKTWREKIFSHIQQIIGSQSYICMEKI